jgi:hypothetical protein
MAGKPNEEHAIKALPVNLSAFIYSDVKLRMTINRGKVHSSHCTSSSGKHEIKIWLSHKTFRVDEPW